MIRMRRFGLGALRRLSLIVTVCASGAMCLAAGADSAAPQAAPKPAAVVKAAAVGEAPAYTPDQKAVLDAVVDADGRLAAEAMDILLQRAAGLGGEDPTLAAAKVVSVESLMAQPDTYRGQLIHLKVRVWRAAQRPGSSTWRLDCTDRATKAPLIVMVAEAPEGLTAGEYPAGPAVAATGLFYKIVRLDKDRPTAGEPGAQLYPVLVAKTLYGFGARSRNAGKATLVVLLIVLCVGYVLAKRSAARRRVQGREPLFSAVDKPATGDEAGRTVNEDLAREARRFKNTQQGGEDQ